MYYRACLIVATGVVLSTLSACGTTYTKSTSAVPSVNVTTASGEKIKGSWQIVIDDSIHGASRKGFKTSSHACSAHTLNIDGSIALRSALQAMTREMFEDVTYTKTVPPATQNYVSFRLDEFSPRVSCQVGSFEGTCSSTADLGVTTVANVADGRRRSFSVSSQRSSDGGAGSMCDKALDVAEEAIRRASKDLAERAGERLSVVLESK